jgi:hypothetical protein
MRVDQPFGTNHLSIVRNTRQTGGRSDCHNLAISLLLEKTAWQEKVLAVNTISKNVKLKNIWDK